MMAFSVSIDGNAASTMRDEIREGEKSAARVVGETALVEATEASWQQKKSAVASTMHRS